jgi:hypothetical protein
MILPNDIGHAEYLAPSGWGKEAFGFMAKLRDKVRQIPSAPQFTLRTHASDWSKF